MKKIWLLALTGLLFLNPASVPAEQKFATLKVGTETYTNVTITTVTVTDIYFSHSRGMGNARIKSLSPDLQKEFHFDAAKSAAAEKAQSEANTSYLQFAATNKPAAAAATNGPETIDITPPTIDENGDLVSSQLHAVSFRGLKPPQIYVDQWLTPAPDVNGKFVLVVFWATWVAPCREEIPHLNALQAEFKDKLYLIAISNESVEEIQKMKSPILNFASGTDPRSRTMGTMKIRALPHALLIDPQGIVRYEGHPSFLEPEHVKHFLARYAK